MKHWIVAFFAALVAFSASAEMLMVDGPLTVRLYSSECTSDTAMQTLATLEAKTPPHRADVMLAGKFIPACWAEDKDGDYIVADREGGAVAFWARTFKEKGA